MLSAVAHGHEPGAEHIAFAAITAARGLDSDRDLLYPDFILAMLGAAARAALDQLMKPANYQYQSDIARKAFSDGKLEGEAVLLLKLLRFKGFTVTPELQARVETCHDVAQLDLWAQRVLTATALTDVFDPA